MSNQKEVWRSGGIWPDPQMLRQRSKWKRTWAVICYCSPVAPGLPNIWIDGSRQWRLLIIKQFKDTPELLKSHSFARDYYPYNGAHHLVVLVRTKQFAPFITEYMINDE